MLSRSHLNLQFVSKSSFPLVSCTKFQNSFENFLCNKIKIDGNSNRMIIASKLFTNVVHLAYLLIRVLKVENIIKLLTVKFVINIFESLCTIEVYYMEIIRKLFNL